MWTIAVESTDLPPPRCAGRKRMPRAAAMAASSSPRPNPRITRTDLETTGGFKRHVDLHLAFNPKSSRFFPNKPASA